MTLIIANEKGIYADTRGIDYGTASGAGVPCKLTKITKHKDGAAAIGFSGPVVTDQPVLQQTLNLLVAYSYHKFFCEEFLAAGCKFQSAFLIYRKIRKHLRHVIRALWQDSKFPSVIAVTRFHNIYITNDGEMKRVEKKDVFMSLGSAERAAEIFNCAGFSIPEIYKRAHVIDNMINGNDVMFCPRSELSIKKPVGIGHYFIGGYMLGDIKDSVEPLIYAYAADALMFTHLSDKNPDTLNNMPNAMAAATAAIEMLSCMSDEEVHELLANDLKEM